MTVHNQLALFGDSTTGQNKPPEALPRVKGGSGGESGSNDFSSERQTYPTGRPKGTISTIEIDRREYRGKTIVLLEDRGMMQKDGTSYQYIIGIETVSDKGTVTLGLRRYITGLMKKRGYKNAYEGARAIFLNPENFTAILGWDVEGKPSEESKAA